MTTFFLFCGFLTMVFAGFGIVIVPGALSLVGVNVIVVERIKSLLWRLATIALIMYVLFLGISPTLMK
jgi:hypothetical protein